MYSDYMEYLSWPLLEVATTREFCNHALLKNLRKKKQKTNETWSVFQKGRCYVECHFIGEFGDFGDFGD
jgi:hypothetical protein